MLKVAAVLIVVFMVGCGGSSDDGPDCVADATGAISWTLLDGCSDGSGIQVRFFDVDNGCHWPSNSSQVWLTPAEGGGVGQRLACIPGATICYGAEPNPTFNSVYWGRSLDGSEACEACCAVCGNGDPPPINLTCN